jgi:uncharacterized protein (DUF1697 family)
MARYVAFLGSINVGGHRVTMDRLRTECEAFGLRNVSTFIASGNVIFEATARPAAVERDLATMLEDRLGFPVSVFVRTSAAVVAVAALDAFGEVGDGETHHVAFLRAAPSAAAITATHALSNDQDTLVVVGTELHWRICGGFASSSIKTATLVKALGQALTVRNITSVRKLAAILGDATSQPRRG